MKVQVLLWVLMWE